MSRAALARWLNLSVIAAVIAVLTLVLISAPPRVAYALDRCGSADGSLAPTVDPTLTLSGLFPTSGQPANVDGVVLTATFDDYLDPPSFVDRRLIANPTSDDRYEIPATFSDSFTDTTVSFMVPADTQPGPLSLSVCYALDDGSGGQVWYFSENELVFTVQEYASCGANFEAQLDPFPDVLLSDYSGLPLDYLDITATGGNDATAGAEGGYAAIENAVYVVVFWNMFAVDQEAIYQSVHTPGNPVFLPSVQVPSDAEPGLHDVGLCYLISDSEYLIWWYTQAEEYTVLEPLPDVGTCFEQPPSTGFLLEYDVDPPALHAGPPGTEDSAVLTALGTEPSLGSQTYYLIWDFGSPDPFTLDLFNADGGSLYTFEDFVVPYDATPELHTIGVCYLFDNDGTLEWRRAGGTIQFNVQAPVPCGTVEGVGNLGDPVVLLPTQGQIGSTFLASITGAEAGIEDALLVQVIWDWTPGNSDNPPGGQVIAEITKSDNSDEASATALVPTAAALGPHNVNICYYVPFDLSSSGVGTAESNFGEWISGEFAVFNVVEGPTSTPPPATSTPPAESTSTPPPDVEPDAPTATLTPTAIPTSTPAPTSTPPILPTIAVVGTSTAVVGGAEPTPPGGGTGTGPIIPAGPGGGPLPNTGVQEATTPGSPTAAPGTPTVVPTSSSQTTPTPTPTPTPSPTATQSPSDDVLGTRTEFVKSVGSFDELTDDFDVILTNVLLTGLFLILIFLTAEIFNQTIRDNQSDVESWMRNFFGPIIGIWGGLSAAMGVATLGNQKLKALFWLGIVLVITVLIEGFLEPGFGFNKESVLLFLSLLVAVGLVTYLTEGGEAFVARGFGQDAAVRVFPAAIGIALICVLMSRLGGFIPGILYGFVGTAVFLRPSTLNQDQTGKMIFFPMALMLGLSVGAWLLVDQFRGPDASDFDIFIEGILIGVLIATIEGVAINMLPIAYMDGRKLIDWNPLVWFATAGVALFLLWTVLLNDQREYFDSLQETTSLVAIIAVVFTFGLSVVTWLWFRYRPGGHA